MVGRQHQPHAMALSPALHLLLVAAACSLGLLQHLVCARSFTCVPVNPSIMVFCGDSVPYLVASDLDIETRSSYAKEQHEKSCSFYAYAPYACRKFFPECRNTSVLVPRTSQATGVTTWVDSGNYTNVEIKICKSACQRGWNDECRRYFPQSGLELECSLPDYYSDGSPPTCVDSGFLDSSTDSSLYWKIGLGAGLGLIACIALFFLARRHMRDKWTPEQMAAYDDAQADKLRARKLKEKQAAEAREKKQREAREKREAKARAKYASNPAAAAGAAAANGAAPPARAVMGSGRGADAAGGEVFSDIEMGSPSPAAPAAVPTAAASADGTGAPRSGAHRSHKHKSHHGASQPEPMMMSPAARKNEVYAHKNSKREGTAAMASSSGSRHGGGDAKADAAKDGKNHHHSSSHKDHKSSSHKDHKKHSSSSHRSTAPKAAQDRATALPPPEEEAQQLQHDPPEEAQQQHAPDPSAPPAPSASPRAVEPAAVRIHFAEEAAASANASAPEADTPPPPQQQQQQQEGKQQQEEEEQQQQQEGVQASVQDDDSWKSGLPTRVAPPEE